MLQRLHSTIQPVHNGILYMLWLTSLVCACSQDLIHVTFSELEMHSYVPLNVRCIVNLSFTFAV